MTLTAAPLRSMTVHVNRRSPAVAAALAVLTVVACGGEGSWSGHVLHGLAFTVRLASGWTASGPDSAQGGSAYTIAGPRNASVEIYAFPPSAPLFAGGDVATADLTTLLAAIGHQNGSTVVDAAPPAATTVGGQPAMQYNVTLLANDGATKAQSEAIDTRFGSYVYYIVYASDTGDFPATDSAVRTMLATWRWDAAPATMPPSPSA